MVTYNSAIAASGWARGLGLFPVLADEVTCNTVINTCNTWQQAAESPCFGADDITDSKLNGWNQDSIDVSLSFM